MAGAECVRCAVRDARLRDGDEVAAQALLGELVEVSLEDVGDPTEQLEHKEWGHLGRDLSGGRQMRRPSDGARACAERAGTGQTRVTTPRR